MSQVIRFRLPYPPSVNAYWKKQVAWRGKPYQSTPYVHVFTSHEATAYHRAVAAVIRKRWPRLKPTSRSLAVRIVMVRPDRRQRDTDNILKATFDSLTYAGFWKDDKQVQRHLVIRGGVSSPGWLDVSIRALGQKQLTLIDVEG